MHLIIFIAVCFTIQEVRDNVCRALCRHEGYQTGFYSPKGDKCICGNEFKFDEFSDVVLKVRPPKKINVNDY